MRQELAPLLAVHPSARRLPPLLRERLFAEARRQAALTALREHELRRLLAACSASQVPVLVMKGAHVAVTCYPRSDLRTRHDTDLIVRERDVDRLRQVLARRGYEEPPATVGGEVLGQAMFDRADVPGATLDVHWRLSASRVAASLFDVDELWSRAVPLPRLGIHAFGPSLPDALALASVHLVAHHPQDDQLLWLYDVHLLLERFGPGDSDRFVALARARRMSRLCGTVIARAAAFFPTEAAHRILEAFVDAPANEPSARLLEARSRLSDLRADLATLGGPRARLGLVAAHVFPPAAYMRATYAPSSRAPLALLYAGRLVRGSFRWLVARR